MTARTEKPYDPAAPARLEYHNRTGGEAACRMLAPAKIICKRADLLCQHRPSLDSSRGLLPLASERSSANRRAFPSGGGNALTKVDFTIISGRRDMAEQRRLVRQQGYPAPCIRGI